MNNEMKAGKVHLLGDNINTDIIISGQYLRTSDPHIFADHVFEVLKGAYYNRKVLENDVIVAGENFGCGSSREQAALAIKYAGFGLVLAKSFGRIFYRNIINQGVIAVVMEEDNDMEQLWKEIRDGDQIRFNLVQSSANIGEQQRVVRFNKPSEFLLNIIDAGGLLNYAKEDSSYTG